MALIAKGITVSCGALPGARIVGFERSGDQTEMLEVKNLASTSGIKEFEAGLTTPGTVTISYEDAPSPATIAEGGATTINFTFGSGSSVRLDGIVTENASFSAQAGQFTSGTLKIQLIPRPAPAPVEAQSIPIKAAK